MQSVFFLREALGPGIDLELPIHYGDFVFLMRIAERWDVGVVAEPLVSVRRHAAQASSALTLSRGISMRSSILRSYVEELAKRRPRECTLRAELEASLEFSHRTGMLWGWVSAPDDAEARACAAGLGNTLVDSAIAVVLRGIDRVAPAASYRRGGLQEAARRLANGPILRF
jgi:hypothetical protein